MTKPAIPHRAIVTLDGLDTLALLERTVTHTVKDWSAGEARYGALLTPQGKIIADYIAVRTATGVYLDVHEDAADDLMKRLKMFRLRADVQIERDLESYIARGATGIADPRSEGLGHRLRVTGVATEIEDLQPIMIASGIPEWGRDYRAAEVFPTDVNMDVMHGIDYKKGCFVGQEVASRMKRRGKNS